MYDLVTVLMYVMGLDSSVGIATRYEFGLSGDQIPVRGHFPTPIQTGIEAHPVFFTMGTEALFRG
jgi:hypothetical protein